MVSDPHVPLLSDFSISEDEMQAVEMALKSADPWEHKNAELADVRSHLVSVKNKLLEFHSARQGGTCCYCRNHFRDRGPFVRDREHVLPKKTYKCLSYTPFNLSVSCKRCNMEIKGSDTSFIVGSDTILEDAQDTARYLFIHPNFDKWDDHIIYFCAQLGVDHIEFYKLKSEHPKAKFTFDYFRLHDLSVRSFDRGQGGADTISCARKLLDDIEKHYGQS